MLGLVCMAHLITCLIPTCGRNNTETTFFLETFFIGYHFITARKVSTAISSLNVREKTFEKSQHTKLKPVTVYIPESITGKNRTRVKSEKVEHCPFKQHHEHDLPALSPFHYFILDGGKNIARYCKDILSISFSSP